MLPRQLLPHPPAVPPPCATKLSTEEEDLRGALLECVESWDSNAPMKLSHLAGNLKVRHALKFLLKYWIETRCSEISLIPHGSDPHVSIDMDQHGANSNVARCNIQLPRKQDRSKGMKRYREWVLSNSEGPDESLVRRLERFYQKHNPEKCKNAAQIARLYGHRVAELKDRLKDEYGEDLPSESEESQDGQEVEEDEKCLSRRPRPPAHAPPAHLLLSRTHHSKLNAQQCISKATPGADDSLVRRLENFYQEHNPQKCKDAQQIAKRFGYRVDALNEWLKAKYGEDLPVESEERQDDHNMDAIFTLRDLCTSAAKHQQICPELNQS